MIVFAARERYKEKRWKKAGGGSIIMLYELNHAASFFADYVIIQYAQATRKPTALGPNFIFYLFIFA